jgi:hypothetical protein
MARVGMCQMKSTQKKLGNETQKKTAETGAKILRQWGLLSSVSAEENEYKKFINSATYTGMFV